MQTAMKAMTMRVIPASSAMPTDSPAGTRIWEMYQMIRPSSRIAAASRTTKVAMPGSDQAVRSLFTESGSFRAGRPVMRWAEALSI